MGSVCRAGGSGMGSKAPAPSCPRLWGGLELGSWAGEAERSSLVSPLRGALALRLVGQQGACASPRRGLLGGRARLSCVFDASGPGRPPRAAAADLQIRHTQLGLSSPGARGGGGSQRVPGYCDPLWVVWLWPWTQAWGPPARPGFPPRRRPGRTSPRCFLSLLTPAQARLRSTPARPARMPLPPALGSGRPFSSARRLLLLMKWPRY